MSELAPNQISRLILRGYKSIADSEILFNRLNILIGANGAGKSNLMRFFYLLNRIVNQRLQVTVDLFGGADAVLHFGRKKTEELCAELQYGDIRYNFALRPTEHNKLIFYGEHIAWDCIDNWQSFSGGHETNIKSLKENPSFSDILVGLKNLQTYHFHDTGSNSQIKQRHNINNNELLWPGAGNLAAFLLRLKNHHQEHYQRIVATVRLVAPFFDDFYLRPTVGNKETIQLEWKEYAQDEIFPASALSDGTLRFICLATVLLQPDEFMPATLLIDEPELGLHPYAISVLASMMQSVAKKHQLIVSTQSVELVNEFSPEDLIIVEKHQGASTFKRPDSQMLADWLNDYSLGELWKKNLLGGRP